MFKSFLRGIFSLLYILCMNKSEILAIDIISMITSFKKFHVIRFPFSFKISLFDSVKLSMSFLCTDINISVYAFEPTLFDYACMNQLKFHLSIFLFSLTYKKRKYCFGVKVSKWRF